MGYMALLRNLRNFDQKNVNLDPILARITNEDAVKKSKQLPYRFYSAYKEIENQKILRAIAQAFELSISNVTLGGSTAVLVDLSGSMTGATVSAKSKVTNAEVAAVLGAIVTKKAKESVVIGFGESARIIKVNPDDTMITNIEKIINTNVGHSTNAGKAFALLNAGNIKVDRIVLVSDMQCYDTSNRSNFYGRDSYVNEEWKKYLAQVNKNAYLYSLDINSYGTRQTPTKSKNVILINGWSDKIIDYMSIVESDVMEQHIAKW